MNQMAAPTKDLTILGRAFGLHILDALHQKRELSFSALLNELGMNRATLSRTLGDLMAQGYVERKPFGRHRYYTITENGVKKLGEYTNPALTEDRIIQLVYKNLKEKGVLDQYPEVSREALLQATRVITLDMMDKIEGELGKKLNEDG
jgi:DNA-binding HxlR family transcriptional regulator